jgi:hypothetical protein
MCKNCYGRSKQAEIDGEPIPKITLKAKPKPTINGKPVHTSIYLVSFGYGDTDYVPSELTGDPCVDVHHIWAGSNRVDRIENLMGLTREEHSKYGDKKHCMSFLFERHRDFMLLSGVKFDMNWIEEQITKWKEDERRN